MCLPRLTFLVERAWGDSAETGVIDQRHEVFGYPALYIIDGAAISANPGVNPALTITALAERAMSLIAEKEVLPSEGVPAPKRARSGAPRLRLPRAAERHFPEHLPRI